MADQAAGRKRVLVADRDDFIIDLCVEHIRHKARADALDLMRAGVALAQDRRGRRLHGHDLDLRALGLQVLADTRHSAAGADARNKDVHIAVRILPDLRAGRRAVDRRVGRVDKLAGDKAVGDLRGQLVGLRDGPLHALRAVREDELRAIGLHDLSALHAHGLRHDNNDAVTSGRGDGRQANAGVAGRGLNDHGVRLERTALLRILDHGQSHAVFHGASRIEVLELCQNAGFELLLFFNMRQLQKGRFSDQLVSGCINLAHEMFLHLSVIILICMCVCFMSRWLYALCASAGITVPADTQASGNAVLHFSSPTFSIG